ncbi:MAG: PEP-CTERM sorting domain-containing protein [Planctomycetia bacterium]|nr:PEP-CTERM sorting domain-containing protein [Planctomycetia bacterium]
MTFHTGDNGYIGNSADSILTISETAKFNMTGGNQLYLGYRKKGTLNYNSSAESTWTNTVRIGTGAEGLLSVTNGKITHSSGYFIVGNDNVGTLAISETAKVKANNLFIGDQYKASGVKGVILVKDSGELSSNVIYLADKTNSVGELTVQDNAVVSTGQFRLGRSQHYNEADTSHTSYLGGGTATATINGGSFSCSQLVMGNQKAPCTLNVLAGTFKTTSNSANTVVGESLIHLAGGDKTTVTLAGSLTLEDTSGIKVTDGTKLTGTSLAFTDNSSLELDGLYQFATLSGSLSFTDDVSLTVYLDDIFMADGAYTLIEATGQTSGMLDKLTLVSEFGEAVLTGEALTPYLDYANGLVLNYTSAIAPVPEPGTWGLMLIGLLGLGGVARKKRS